MHNTPQSIFKYPRDWDFLVPLAGFPWPREMVQKPATEDTWSAVDYLLSERYSGNKQYSFAPEILQTIYYLVKPYLPRSIQLGIQRCLMRKNRGIRFPREPFEPLLSDILDFHLKKLAKERGIENVPRIAFWPEGYESAFCFTHDVETQYGYEKLPKLVALEKQYGLRTTIFVVPERYQWNIDYLRGLAQEGFEIGLHGLNHDNRLFRTREVFEEQCKAMDKYAKVLAVDGFRSPALQRCYSWMADLPGIYDSSYPDVELFSLYPGGCCHVLPWFIEQKVEIPVTMQQDHYLFNLRKELDTEAWRVKWDIIKKRRGLGCVIIHPDYMINTKHQEMFEELIDLVTQDSKVWVTTLVEVAKWWLERSQAQLVEREGKYLIENSNRARVEYAVI
jgi:peptidoglycan/xylan/chitin deacetylase (PgdA/CDA1 family)